MFRSIDLQLVIGTVHSKEQQHDHHFKIKNIIGILFGPSGHFPCHKTIYIGNIPSGPENNNSHQHEESQDLKGTDKKTVKDTRASKDSMRAKDTVEDDLQYLNI